MPVVSERTRPASTTRLPWLWLRLKAPVSQCTLLPAAPQSQADEDLDGDKSRSSCTSSLRRYCEKTDRGGGGGERAFCAACCALYISIYVYAHVMYVRAYGSLPVRMFMCICMREWVDVEIYVDVHILVCRHTRKEQVRPCVRDTCRCMSSVPGPKA